MKVVRSTVPERRNTRRQLAAEPACIEKRLSCCISGKMTESPLPITAVQLQASICNGSAYHILGMRARITMHWMAWLFCAQGALQCTQRVRRLVIGRWTMLAMRNDVVMLCRAGRYLLQVPPIYDRICLIWLL